jgi:hypothetical protein
LSLFKSVKSENILYQRAITLVEDAVDIVSILQTSVEKDEDTNIYNNGSKESYRQPLHFLICDSCFWCASCIRLDALDVKCPSCNGNKVEWMPINDGEIHKVYYYRKDLRVREFFFDSRDGIT